MRAVVFENYKTFPVLKDVEKPKPGPGEVLLKVAGTGACHSDVAVYNEFDANTPGAVPPSFTPGHENSGWVEELGEGVTGFRVGDADPVAAAPLSDAALTPYHAIRMSLPNLAGGGRFALVVGLGGLGQIAVQILKALTGATVIATDMKEEAMAKAAAHGAITVPGGPDQAARIREITGGRGVDAAFDFVGAAPTVKTAAASMAIGSRLTVVGIANGPYEWSFFGTPYESTITNTYWGTIEDLHEVAAMYRAGQIVTEIERFGMEDALEAYRRLEAGELSGRAVVVPHGA